MSKADFNCMVASAAADLAGFEQGMIVKTLSGTPIHLFTTVQAVWGYCVKHDVNPVVIPGTPAIITTEEPHATT